MELSVRGRVRLAFKKFKLETKDIDPEELTEYFEYLGSLEAVHTAEEALVDNFDLTAEEANKISIIWMRTFHA